MLRKHLDYYMRYLNHDIPAGVVVFLVALPLCLGIAVASGAPPFSGVIAGVIGGLVVSVVIKGMLAAIGLILIMKQLPHAVGYDADAESDLSFLEDDSNATFSFVWSSLNYISPGATIVALVSLAILLLWDSARVKSHRILSLVPGPLVAVIFGVLFNAVAKTVAPALVIAPQHLVSLPQIFGLAQFAGELHFPNFRALADTHVYVTAATLALVGSLETLLSLEAVDKLDPLKRTAPTDQELKAQGVGNFLSGMMGGLPITAVIVRSSANIDAGAHTKVACIVHGALLLLSVMLLSSILNMIPLACLAALLLLTGYKLAKPKLVIEQFEKGFAQFAPFAVTIAAILLTDLLKGMAIGMAVGLGFVLHGNYQSAFTLTRDGKNYLLRMQKDVSFLNRGPLRNLLADIEDDSSLMIDGTRATFIDHDILETLEDFMQAARENNIRIELKNVRGLESVPAMVAA